MHTEQAEAVPTPIAVRHLPDDPATLQTMILELPASLQQRERDNAALQHRLDLLLRRLYGPRGERFDPNQPLLFAEPAADSDTATATAPPAAAADAASKRRCRPHGRRRLPENLPRQARHHELPEAARLCPGCGQRRLDIGVDTSEQLDYRPASLIVIEHFVHKYVCPGCSKPQAQACGRPGQPARESKSMPMPQPESPSPPTEPTPAPSAADSRPEPVSATRESRPRATDPRRRRRRVRYRKRVQS